MKGKRKEYLKRVRQVTLRRQYWAPRKNERNEIQCEYVAAAELSKMQRNIVRVLYTYNVLYIFALKEQNKKLPTISVKQNPDATHREREREKAKPKAHTYQNG